MHQGTSKIDGQDSAILAICESGNHGRDASDYKDSRTSWSSLTISSILKQVPDWKTIEEKSTSHPYVFSVPTHGWCLPFLSSNCK